MIKVHSRKTKMDPKWEGPDTVLLTSYVAVEVTGKENWIHTHVKRIPKEHQLNEQPSAMQNPSNPAMEIKAGTI